MASTFRRGGERNGVVARIARTHRQQLRDVTAARGCVDTDLRAVPVPGCGIRLEPAHRIVGVLHAGRIRRFGRDRHVDGDDQQAARRQRAIHRFFGKAVFSVPGTAVQIENGRERSRSLRLVNPRHQHPAGAVAPKLDFADGKIEAGGGIIRGRAGGISGARPQRAHGRQTGRARSGHHLENVAPNESALGQVRLPQHGLVAAMIGSRQTPAMGASRRRRWACRRRVRNHIESPDTQPTCGG